MVLKSVTLTGASGMMGRYMVQAAAQEGISCVCTSRKKPQNIDGTQNWFAWDLQNVKEIPDLDRCFGSVDAVVHLAGVIHQPATLKETCSLIDVNVRSCLNLAAWALHKKIPFVFLSSATVYASNDNKKITETSELINSDKANIYAFSKKMAEEIVLQFVSKGLRAIILRPSSIYGFGLPKEKMVIKFLQETAQGKTLKLAPPVSEKINFIHAADVARAIVVSLKSKAAGIFNIASDKPSTILELAQACKDVTQSGRLEYEEDKKPSPAIRFNLSNEKAKKQFGFKPQVSLTEGLEEIWGKIQSSVESVNV